MRNAYVLLVLVALVVVVTIDARRPPRGFALTFAPTSTMTLHVEVKL